MYNIFIYILTWHAFFFVNAHLAKLLRTVCYMYSLIHFKIYCKLRIQACVIFLAVIVKMFSISCCI